MYYFIVNPNSKCGQGQAVWKRVLRAIESEYPGLQYEVYMTAKAGDAREFSRRITSKCKERKSIIVIGGDGTLSEVVDGTCLNCDHAVISLIPTGTGNDFARGTRMRRRRPEQALARLLREEKEEYIDYGLLNCVSGNRRFVVSTGLGFDAAICHCIMSTGVKEKLHRLRLNKLVYIVAGLKELLRLRPCRGYIVLDKDKRYEFNNILFVAALNQPSEGGGFRLAPAALCNDGLMDVCVISCRNKFKLVGIMLAALRGRHVHNSGVHLYQCTELEIHTERALPLHMDGEDCGCEKDLYLSLVPRKLKIQR